MDPVILCNPGHGNNPFLRCVEIALAVNKERGEDSQIIVPLLYGDRQKKLLQEEFGDRPEMTYDEELGALIRPLLYSGTSYAEDLERWLHTVDTVSQDVQGYIQQTYPEILCEIARVPMVETGIRPAFATGFAHLSEIFARAAKEPEITIDRALLKNASERMQKLESQYDRIFLTEPGTFETKWSDDLLPPILTLRKSSIEIPEPSIYVTASGIPSMEKLLGFVRRFDLPVYANDSSRVPGSISAPPDVLTHPHILFHIARAGWGSLWSSLLTGVPLVAPPYDTADDPEIFFNLRRMEELGLGLTYGGQTAKDLSAKAALLRPGIGDYREGLRKRFGTLDGAKKAAQKLVAMLRERQ